MYLLLYWVTFIQCPVACSLFRRGRCTTGEKPIDELMGPKVHLFLRSYVGVCILTIL